MISGKAYLKATTSSKQQLARAAAKRKTRQYMEELKKRQAELKEAK